LVSQSGVVTSAVNSTSIGIGQERRAAVGDGQHGIAFDEEAAREFTRREHRTPPDGGSGGAARRRH
jgi:hypothetical protein